ncbi:MAG: hypothetical protein KDA93_03670 [Planctomycetaceae bacterium]|nr:hypothetical protein [Planctomycetaceae bacterium]
MGKIRDREFDAVIGVGGISHKPRMIGIDGKVNWIGIGPRKTVEYCKQGYDATIVRFEYFQDFGMFNDVKMPAFRKQAPRLSRRMYVGNVRHCIVDETHRAEFREVVKLLKLVVEVENFGRGAKDGDGKSRPCTKKTRKMKSGDQSCK